MIRLGCLAVLLAAAALPAAAQDGTTQPQNDNIVVVPLDPVTPGEIVPANPNDQGGFVPLAPVDPNEVVPGGPTAPGAPQLIAPPAPGSVVGEDVTTVTEDEVTQGTGAVLKGLDKLAGTVQDLTLTKGQTVNLGWLQITLAECRYPIDNPAGDAFAWLVIRDKPGKAPIFQGWMVASSPALNALDNSRYDVWVSHCTTE
jgi:hypothetical protein